MALPITALTWEIWRRNRGSVWLVIGIILFGWLFNLVLPDTFRATEASRNWLGALNSTLTVISLLLVFGIFSYTEFNPQKESMLSLSSLCPARNVVAACGCPDIAWHCRR